MKILTFEKKRIRLTVAVSVLAFSLWGISGETARAGSETKIDDFSGGNPPKYSFYCAFRGSGTVGTELDFGEARDGVWTPQGAGRCTNYFIVDDENVALEKVGDSVSLEFQFTDGFNGAIGLILSNAITVDSRQTEIFVQHSGGNPGFYNFGGESSSWARQNDYSILRVTFYGYDEATDESTIMAEVTEGGLHLEKSYTIPGKRHYIGLGMYSSSNEGVGATGRNFVLTKAD